MMEKLQIKDENSSSAYSNAYGLYNPDQEQQQNLKNSGNNHHNNDENNNTQKSSPSIPRELVLLI